ncbi:hypothetical protein CSPX01_05520 [Colletotrichum filicis]|nr:hypothetical protein CSPX01_05520 [Colletotrichum filicis]
MSFHPDSLPDLDGKVFIVTGGAITPYPTSQNTALTFTCVPDP